MGNWLQEKGQTSEAIAIFCQATQGSSRPEDRAVVFNDIGVILRRQGKLKEAMAAFQQSLKRMPSDTETAQT